MERIRDLLDPSRANLAIREDKHKGLSIDATEVYMTSSADFEDCMRLGTANRAGPITTPFQNAEERRFHLIHSISTRINGISTHLQ